MRDEEKTKEQLANELAELRQRVAELEAANTEHKQAEREERRLYLEGVLGAAPDAIVTLDARHRIVEWNPGAERLFGYSQEEVIGQDIDDVITNPDTFGEAVGFTRIVMGKGELPPVETIRYRKDGSPVDVIVAGSPILVGDRFIGAVAVYTDITERKRAEEALRESLKQIERAKREWESTADSLSELICLVDDQGRIIRANRTVETWNLARVTEVKGREFHELLHPGGADSPCYLDSFWKQAWGKALQGQPAQCEAYDEHLQRYVLIQVQPSKGWGKGATDGSTVIVVQDITERKRAEEALKEYAERLEEMVEERTRELRDAQERLLRAERLAAIGQLGASVGHELRNPLGIIKNSIYYINMKLSEADEKVKKHLGIIENEVARSDKIINDLMNFARDQKVALRKTHINTIVRDALSRTRVPDSVVVITHLDEDLPPLMADPSQLEQVFINMISNAVQAVSEGGRLEITTKAEEGFIVTEFKDTGCGIPEENLEKIFEPLFTTKAKGIGLGLAVSKQIIEAHKGSIEVESLWTGLRPHTEPVEVTGEMGKGTTFRVRLPISVG
ncbi:MAG: PAS domain S-box protein [Chloroflexi bacterium]|nr:PAS domain S-box protein [Chloroflexota bacterium]